MDGTLALKKYDILARLQALEEGGGGGSKHEYSTEEQEVGTWIDGKTMYERTFILKENGEDKYPRGGIDNKEYLIGLENVVNVWVDKIQEYRRVDNNNFVDSRNISGEIITTFDITTGGLYYNTTHVTNDISVVLQYTKQTETNHAETKKRSKKK